MSSIRAYLLTRLLCGTALILALAGAGVYLVVARSLGDQFDRNLTDRVQGLASLLFQVEDHVEFEFSDELMPEYERDEQPAFFELWFEDGEVLERSNSLGEADLELAGPAGAEPRHWSAPLPDGRAGRFVAQRREVHHVYPELGPERPEAAQVVLAVARGREELVAAERAVLAGCVGVGLAVLLLIGALSWTAVERGLGPARRLATRLGALRVERLPERLDAGPLPLELRPIGETADQLVRRVADALRRERRTTADIAHELRTPISELLTVSEVALRDGEVVDGARRALGTVRDVAWRMGGSVATLLKLARLEMGAESFDREDVDARALLAEVRRPLRGLQRERALEVREGTWSDVPLRGDREALRIVLANLLGNALQEAPSGSEVVCELERRGAGWRLSVLNRAPGLTREDLRSLTEPFWRKDRARADRQRSGLGLALSSALAERAGLELAFELEGGWLRASLVDPGPPGSAPTNGAARRAASPAVRSAGQA